MRWWGEEGGGRMVRHGVGRGGGIWGDGVNGQRKTRDEAVDIGVGV